MSSTEISTDAPMKVSAAGSVPMRLEVVVVPVSDVDRAKSFYQGLGWRLDGDAGGGGYRLVQLTPPASNTSIIIGKGVSSDEPGSIDGLVLAVDDLAAARDELISHGVDVSEVFHDARGSLGGGFHTGTEEGRAAGPDPEHRSYASYASFRDPDGNKWLLQEITERLPGRLWGSSAADVAARAELLHDAAEHHDAFEAVAPPHDWWDWYSAYMTAREGGSDPEAASASAGRYMADVKGVVVESA